MAAPWFEKLALGLTRMKRRIDQYWLNCSALKLKYYIQIKKDD